MAAYNQSSPRRRGAPTGNKNALKHGFYSAPFNKADRDALESSEFSGLSEEITLLRLVIRQLAKWSPQITDFAQYLEAVRVISLACSSLSRLVRTHHLMQSSGEDEFKKALDEALQGIVEDWNLR
jgi:hypothetical protein